MSSIVAHLTWGALTSLFPLMSIGLRYINQPSLHEKLFPFEFLIHLPVLCAIVNLALNIFLAPMIKSSDYAPYTNWILGIAAGLIYATYAMNVGEDELPATLFGIKNDNNIYFYMVFYWMIIYGLILP